MADNGGRGGKGGGHRKGKGGGGRGGGGGGGGGRGRGQGDRGYGGGDQGHGGHQDLPFRDAPRGRGRGRGGGRGGRELRAYNPGVIPQPSAEVDKVETEIENKLLKTSRSNAAFPLRPGYGTQGKKIILWANYMELATKTNVHDCFRYSTIIGQARAGQTLPVKKCKHIIDLMLEQHFPAERANIATDSRSNLISSSQLPQVPHNEDGTVFQVRWKAEDEDNYSEEPDIYPVAVKFTMSVSVSDLLNYLASSNANDVFSSKADAIQALNIIVGEYPKSLPDVASIGANKHMSINPAREDHFSLGNGLEAIRGYFVSVRAATARILLNVQVKNIAVYETGGGLKGLIETASQRNKNPYVLERFLKTLRVQLMHLTRNGRRPRQKGIFALASPSDGAKNQSPRPQVKRHGAGPKDVQFWQNGSAPTSGKKGPSTTGKYISVADYFLKEYNIKTDPNFPVINVGTREKPSYLPAEVCQVVAGQPAKTKLSPDQTAKMIRFAVRPPADNAESIVQKGTPLLGFAPMRNRVLETFGLDPNPNLITVPGRVLVAPRITYGNKSYQPFNADWNLTQHRFKSAKTINSWSWLGLDLGGWDGLWGPDLTRINTHLSQWTRELLNVGIRISNKPTIDGLRVDLRGEGWEGRLEEIIRTVAEMRLDFFLILLPSTDSAIYNAVKLFCDVRYGVRHACVVQNSFKDRGIQYHANTSLKVNLKLGGTNHVLENNQLGIIDQGKTMLVGIDVTHPSPGSSSNAKSIAGIVASIDKTVSQFPAALRVQTAKQEKVDSLDILLKSRLELWRKHNKVYPQNIIVYRDGVSEGQYDMVVNEELPQLKKACRDLYPAQDQKQGFPRISIVVVGKRHHTRFYVTKLEDAGQSTQNPPNGTVVDRGVTEARTFDFFLQAHKASLGTARPGHYITVYDEIFCTDKSKPGQNAADTLQNLSHRLCYTFGRATKAVSICPPAYYADLVCERARCYLSDSFDPTSAAGSVSGSSNTGQSGPTQDMVTLHDNIKDTMFYI